MHNQIIFSFEVDLSDMLENFIDYLPGHLVYSLGEAAEATADHYSGGSCW